MALLQWNSTLSVGVERFDSEHRKLLEMVNGLHDAMQEGKGKALVNETLTGLITYTATHFTAEETLLAKHGFPGLDHHREEHTKLVAQVFEFQREAAAGRALPAYVLNFLKDWLVNHIMKEDKSYAPFLAGKGEK